MKLLSFTRKVKQRQRLKERVLKNKEALLGVMSENIKGARQCPFLLGEKCLGRLCEHFMEFKTINNATGETFSFFRCAHVQLPLLIMELNENIRALLAKREKEDENKKNANEKEGGGFE